MAANVELWKSIITLFHQNPILSIGILLLSGFLLGKFFETIHIPAITGYILAGLVLGDSVTGIVNERMSHAFSGITEIALGLIALTIGGEFSVAKIKRVGLKILVLTLFEAFFAFAAVTAALSLIGVDVRVAFIMGAISAATAPAATVVIIRELRARGEFIDYLYGVVAFDDAVCVLLFSVVFATVTPLLTGVGVAGGVMGSVLKAVLEILWSVIAGVVGGFFVHLLTRKKYKVNEIMLITLAILFIVSAFTKAFSLSPLIADMMMGTVIVNLSHSNRRIFDIIEPLTAPVFALFFILAGTEFKLEVFEKGVVVLIGLVYLVSRFIGKNLGIQISGILTNVQERIRNYLGICLFPQAGVAIGLALVVKNSQMGVTGSPLLEETLSLIVNVVLFSVCVNELVGPILSRIGIKKGTEMR